MTSVPSTIRYFDLIIVLLFAGYYFWLTLSNIYFHGIWTDESYSIQLGLHPVAAIMNEVSAGRDAPLYYLILHFWEIPFGISELSVRSLSVIFSVLTLAMLYLLGKKFFNRQTAFYSCLLYVGSTFELHYAMETRAYALVGLLAVLSLYLFFSLVYTPSWKKCIALGIVNALLIYTHYASVFVIVVETMASLLFFMKYRVPFFKMFIASMFISLAFILPWAGHIISHILPGNSWQMPPTRNDLDTLLDYFFFNDYSKFRMAIWFTGITLLLIITTRKRRELSWPKLISLLFLATVPVALAFYISSWVPIFVFRYVMYALLGIFLFLGYLFSLAPISAPIKILVSLLFFSTLHGAAALGAYCNEDWQYAIPVVRHERQIHPHSRILVGPAYQDGTFAYHWDKKKYVHYETVHELLKKDSVFAVDNMGQLDFHLEPLPSEIIFIHTAPMDDLCKKLDSAYQYKHDNAFCGVHVAIYRERP